MNLSKNFTLSEMTATRYNVKNVPNDTQIEALKLLCEKVLQPLRDLYGQPIHVNSGYRSLQLNSLIKGAKASQHCKGEAADLDAGLNSDNKILFELIKNNFDFDQLINEYDYSWIHVSYKKTGNRNQTLVIT